MVWMVMFFAGISIYFALRLYLLKKCVRTLAADFSDTRKNLCAEGHVQISAPDKDLEYLAEELNGYIEVYFQKQYEDRQELLNVQNEITNLSHDLRTPLTSMLGYLDLLEDDNLAAEQKDDISIIKRRGRHLNELLEQLYEYARLQNHDYLVKSAEVDLYKIVQEHMLSYFTEFEQHKMQISLNLPQNQRPLIVKGDSKCIERILVNLTSNSIKYSKGELIVSLKVEKDNAVLTYQTIRGNLTADDISRMFDRFYQKDEKRSDVMGSGLGLTITKLFMERMGGAATACGDDNYLYISCLFLQK